MVSAIILAGLTLLTALLPRIMKVVDKKEKIADALANRSVDELDAGAERLRKPPTV